MRSFLLLATAVLTLAACDATAPSTQSTAVSIKADDTTAGDVDGRTLAQIRRATARYHRVEQALADGWGAPPEPEAPAPISPCVDDSFPVDLGADLGGMGHHYINLKLMDGELDPLTPEILLYEPTKNGRFRLVGVEYVVPFGVEPREADGGTAPELLGQTFHPSEGAGGWALHVWTWKNNPAGLFADFNPNVSCEYAAAPDA